MPKASKPSTITSRRAIPYPPAATPVIAPALTPIMETDRAISPPRAGADRPGPHTWVSEDDEKLMDARKQGLNWQPIAARYFPDKTPNACRKRHERLMEKRNAADNWNGVKIEAMAKAYMELREQMWTILAEQVGERWQTVETKCMEKGLKTLQTAGRSASRSRRQTFDVGAIDQMTDTRYQAPLESQGDDIFNDSGLGQDPEHHFLPNAQSDQRRHYATSIHTEPAPFSAGAITPPYSSNRSYSQCSSSNGISVINTSPYQTIQQPSPFQQQQQTLPSFSSAFGQPIVSSLPPATTQRRSPH